MTERLDAAIAALHGPVKAETPSERQQRLRLRAEDARAEQRLRDWNAYGGRVVIPILRFAPRPERTRFHDQLDLMLEGDH